MQLPPELLYCVPAEVHTCLEEWWLTGYRQPGVDKDLWIPYQEWTLLSIRCLFGLSTSCLSYSLVPGCWELRSV